MHESRTRSSEINMPLRLRLRVTWIQVTATVQRVSQPADTHVHRVASLPLPRSYTHPALMPRNLNPPGTPLDTTPSLQSPISSKN